MPGRKKGRQRGGAGSKAQCAKRWNDTLRDAKEDLASERKTKFVRPGDAAPPRLSTQGFRSLATLLHQRVRADQVETEGREPGRTSSSSAAPGRGAPSAGRAVEGSYFLTEWSERISSRRARSLLSMCIIQIGRDFLEYRTEDEAVAQAFLLLPARCISRISRAASARGTIADHNIGLLCSPGVGSLWLRGRFTNEGADALLPTLRGGKSTNGKHGSVGSVAELAEAFREDFEGGDDDAESAQAKKGSACGVIEEIGGAEGWETADDRMEACLQGVVSITSLDLSSPLLTPVFIARLVLRIPTLRRLGLKGSLDVMGGPDALCDDVPRLTALRELDVSYCTWFCDLCLRRFAKAMWRRFSASGLNEISDRDHRDSHSRWMVAMEQEQEGAVDWGAASAPVVQSGGDLPARGRPGGRGTAERWPGDVRTSGVGAWGGGGGEAANDKKATRFRTFTLTCARTAVTEKGARKAESLSPGKGLPDKTGNISIASALNRKQASRCREESELMSHPFEG